MVRLKTLSTAEEEIPDKDLNITMGEVFFGRATYSSFTAYSLHENSLGKAKNATGWS
jgi:hypothetical protein